ncbi:MAG TPA: hypothetical protein VGD80_16725, partial [Kofleriaceae bacterium]
MVADPRNPSGRRPPILPLPPPPDTDEPGATPAKVATLPLHDDPGGTTMQVPAPPRRRRSPTTDVAAELPRLPEVGLHDGSSEVDV